MHGNIFLYNHYYYYYYYSWQGSMNELVGMTTYLGTHDLSPKFQRSSVLLVGI